MQELTLEREFELYKQLHKTTILQAKITTYYKDMQQAGVTIPDFLLTSPEKLAEKEVINIFCHDQKLFDKLYERAWNEYAEYLP